MAKPVLVTSAAGGRQGKTGRHVSEMLLKRGIPVRAFVHKIDERSEALRAQGAEIFEGDFLDVRSVKRAVEGTSSTGDAAIVGRCPDPADATELSVRTGV